MKEGSMLESARAILEANGTSLKFADLWAKVKEDLEISAEEEYERIGHFYTDLSLSGEFVVLTDNCWDLRSRHKFDDVRSDVNAVYSDIEESDKDAEDKQEEDEYNESINGPTFSDDGGDSEGEEENATTDEERDAISKQIDVY